MRPMMAYAGTDELKEVLLNVLENARNAQARRVIVSVSQQSTPGDVQNGPDVTDLRVRRRRGDLGRYSAAHFRAALFDEHQRQRSWSGDQPAARRGMGRIDLRVERRRERRYGPDRAAGGPAGDAASFRRTVLMFTNSRMPKALSSRP